MLLIHNKIPNAYNLYIHHIIHSPQCNLCGQLDDQWHLFMNCTAFKNFREEATWIDWGEFDIVSFISNMNRCEQENLITTKQMNTLWILWETRNEAIFRNAAINVQTMIRKIEEETSI